MIRDLRITQPHDGGESIVDDRRLEMVEPETEDAVGRPWSLNGSSSYRAAEKECLAGTSATAEEDVSGFACEQRIGAELLFGQLKAWRRVQ